VAVDSSHIYFIAITSTGAEIWRADLDGQNITPGIITGLASPAGIALDSGHIYWTDTSGPPPTTIGRADLDGQNVNQSFITGATFPLAIAVDSGHIYWSNGGFNPATIGRADLDGQNVNQDFITTQLGTCCAGPAAMAVDRG
jgi:sugar lactone lactonase YvrE